MTTHLDMPPNKCSESLSHHPKEFGFNVKDSSLCHSLSTFGCFFLTFSFLISVSQMRVCSGKRLLLSGMRQIWTCPTRGSLTTLMTVSSFLFSLFFVNFLIWGISPGQIIFSSEAYGALALCLHCMWSLFSKSTLSCSRDRVAAAVCAK